MQPIQRNKPVFFGNNGKLLVNGKVFIGQPDKDPETYPKTVTFQDNSGNQFQAGQPLRTNENGQLSYNGNAIIALVDGDYSMLIKTFDNVQVDDGYTARVSQIDGGGDLTGNYIQYAPTLSEVKSVNVQQGDVVENIGGAIATDGLGKRWLAQLPNGQAEDNVNFIDFTNGLQGARIIDEAKRIQDDQLLGQSFGSFELLASGTPSIVRNNSRADISFTRVSTGIYDITVDSSAFANGTAFRYYKILAQGYNSGSLESNVSIINLSISVANQLSFRAVIRDPVGDTIFDTAVSFLLIA